MYMHPVPIQTSEKQAAAMMWCLHSLPDLRMMIVALSMTELPPAIFMLKLWSHCCNVGLTWRAKTKFILNRYRRVLPTILRRHKMKSLFFLRYLKETKPMRSAAVVCLTGLNIEVSMESTSVWFLRLWVITYWNLLKITIIGEFIFRLSVISADKSWLDWIIYTGNHSRSPAIYAMYSRIPLIIGSYSSFSSEQTMQLKATVHMETLHSLMI